MSRPPSEAASVSDVPRAPAPWTLTGDAYIVMLELPADARDQGGREAPGPLQGRLEGRTSLLMLVDYKSSNVGPYRELLFIPGRFRALGRLYWSITRIFVSSWESVVNGRENWGIPKDHADFEIIKEADGAERFVASRADRVVAELKFKAVGPPIPSTAALLPESARTLVHYRDGQYFFCAPFARGRVRYARMLEARIDPAILPDISRAKVRVAVRLSDFTMEFPAARIIKTEAAE